MAKQPKMILCRKCQTSISKKEKYCPACGAKNKKPLIKRFLSFLLIVILLVAILVATVSIINSNNRSRFVWNEIDMSTMLPTPQSNLGFIFSDSDEHLTLHVDEITKSDYKKYRAQCIEMGFSDIVKSDETSFIAYTQAGYKLSLTHIYKAMTIELDAPINMTAIQWPKSEIASMIPVPQSRMGSIDRESSDSFIAYIGETSLEDYRTYVNACSQEGFDVDYEKDETYYRADNKRSYQLTLEYLGHEIMKVCIEAPSEDSNDETEPETIPTSTPTSEPVNSMEEQLTDGMRPSFVQAMESYESFFDEYCEFISKYNKSDKTDLSLLSDYAEYMEKYTKAMSDLEAWENDKEMNNKETAYFVKVQTEINQKLLKTIQ